MAPHSLCCNKKTKQGSILILKGSRDLSDKKLWNKFLVARANGIAHTTSDPYCGVVPMFSYIDSFIMAPHYSRNQR